MPKKCRSLRWRITLGIGALFLLSGCNTTSSKIPFAKEEYRTKNEALLYVYRDRAFVGGGVETVVYFDEIAVGLLPQNGYFPIHAVAGMHKLKICSGNIVASTECKILDLNLKAQDHIHVRPVMHAGNDFHFEAGSEIEKLTDKMNQGNFYDPAIRSSRPAAAQRLTLSAAALGADGGAAPLKIAILNFSDETKSELYGWLAGSLPDAIDQTMRRDFDYKRHGAGAGANVVISGNYRTTENDRIRIEAQVLYADTGKVLATEAVDSPVDAQIFNATKLLSDKLVAKLHEIVRKP